MSHCDRSNPFVPCGGILDPKPWSDIDADDICYCIRGPLAEQNGLGLSNAWSLRQKEEGGRGFRPTPVNMTNAMLALDLPLATR